MTKAQHPFGSDLGSLVAAILRVIGFFGLIFLLTPILIYYNWRHPEKPFVIQQLFHRLLTRILGFRVRVHGAMAITTPVLFVANHSSYLDIPVLGALLPAAFVAKAEVASWPLIGTLAKMQKTQFIERRSTQISAQRNQLREHLARGRNLVLFPEGTSSTGLNILPFKSSLFAIADDMPPDVALTIQPVSITCTELDGLPITRYFRPFYAWFGDMTLTGHHWNVFKFGHFTIDVVFHTPVSKQDFPDRKALSSYCQQQVGRGIEQCLAGRGFAEETTLRIAAPIATN